jgi:uncharacterized protein
VTSFTNRIDVAKAAIDGRSMDGIERRTVPFSLTELRSRDDGGFVIVGHAAVFDSLSENLGGFREKIAPGAFANVLEEKPDVRALFNHDPNLMLARTANGTLALAEDAKGLAFRADVPAKVAATYIGGYLNAALDTGLVDQSSFAFRVAEDSWDEDEDGRLVRTVREFSELYDVSPVTYPAYPATDSGVAA